jgi:hypothetical protein
VFYVSRIVTDQVAGVGSSLKHAIGRRRMLATVSANLKRIREQLETPIEPDLEPNRQSSVLS